jgi:hypothetical protein
MLKHHCLAFFISCHSQNTPAHHFLTIFIAETTPSSTCFDFLPFVAETPLAATLHFSHPPSSTKQFRPAIVSPLSVVETPFVSNPSSFIHNAETPLFSMIDFFPMQKHHHSTLFHFLPILKHLSSVVLHLHQLFRSSLLLEHQSLTIVPLNRRPSTQSKAAATTASPRTSMISSWLNKPNGKARYVNIV